MDKLLKSIEESEHDNPLLTEALREVTRLSSRLTAMNDLYNGEFTQKTISANSPNTIKIEIIINLNIKQ